MDSVNPTTGLPQISEAHVLEKVRHLSETIGYRTVGTREHAAGEEWLLEELHALKSHCEELVQATPRALECEILRQEGSGTHRFDMMDRRVYKNYVNLSNILFRISNGTESSKEHAILINSHLDSTLPSPGAADDALPAALMLDSIRVLIDTPSWTPQYSIIYLWNNAEESLQDGSHLFATQNIWAGSARAVINLEAAGVSGPELLFQATSEEMIEAYSHVPWPYGTVLANDVFSSGIILSDTDFRQFEEYGNLTGLDMAVVGDSYLYHTRKDVVENIQAGVTQHMGENLMALLLHLTSESSPLPRMRDYTPPKTTYFGFLGRYFVMWKFSTSERIYNTFFGLSLVLSIYQAPRIRLRVYGASLLGLVGGIVGAIVSVNVVALLLTKVFDRGLSWFAREWSILAVYGGPTLVAFLSAQFIARSVISKNDAQYFEYATIIVLHLFWTGVAAVLQFFGIGSAVLGFLWGLSSGAALLVHYALSFRQGRGDRHRVGSAVYVVGQFIPSVLGAEVAASIVDIFVPLTGRMGKEAPAEHIIATIVAIIGFLCVPFVIPLAHRFPRRLLLSTIAGLIASSALMVIVFSSGVINSFDELHPRRIFVLHAEDVVSGELALHISASDSAPGLDYLVADIARTFCPGVNASSLQSIKMDEWNADWDILYPFSQFLTPYTIPLPPAPFGYLSPWAPTSTHAFTITTSHEIWHPSNQTRSLVLVIDHPDVIWTVVAFDAHVLSWSLDSNPLPHMARHHVKEASFYGVTQWTLPLEIAATTPGEKPELKVSFQGITERGMWPGKKNEGGGLLSMDLFERIDEWMDKREDAAYDTMLLGVVGGVVTV